MSLTVSRFFIEHQEQMLDGLVDFANARSGSLS